MAREGPSSDVPWLRRASRGRAAWDSHSPLVQNMDQMIAEMGADNAYRAVAGVGAAIEVIASRTGSNLSARDSTLLGQVLGSLNSAERMALASGGNSAVLGKVNALIEH